MARNGNDFRTKLTGNFWPLLSKPAINSVRLLFFILIYFNSSAHAAASSYGHKPYSEIQRSGIVEVAKRADGRIIYLEKNAAVKLKAMLKAAAADGVKIKIISGFRSVSYQTGLFKRAVKRYGSKPAAAKFVAPPGYSEHHTGKAVDLGDASSPQTDLKASFESTTAHEWLSKNASHFGFYLSFPKNNKQGVAYEPWHWCYKI